MTNTQIQFTFTQKNYFYTNTNYTNVNKIHKKYTISAVTAHISGWVGWKQDITNTNDIIQMGNTHPKKWKIGKSAFCVQLCSF